MVGSERSEGIYEVFDNNFRIYGNTGEIDGLIPDLKLIKVDHEPLHLFNAERHANIG
jgi:hypothetical protein